MTKAKFAGMIIIEENKILLVQESHKEAYGLWSFPLGHVDDGEQEKNAAIRETKEETGFDVLLGKCRAKKIDGRDFKSTNDYNTSSIKLYVYEAKIKGGELKSGDGILDVKWFPLSDFYKLPLRGAWMTAFLSYFFYTNYHSKLFFT